MNNIIHINHSGANINIMSGPNIQNHINFNNTAPVNLNFYKDNNQTVASPTQAEVELEKK